MNLLIKFNDHMKNALDRWKSWNLRFMKTSVKYSSKEVKKIKNITFKLTNNPFTILIKCVVINIIYIY